MANNPHLDQVYRDYEFLSVETVDGVRHFMFGEVWFNDDYTEATIYHLMGETRFERPTGDFAKWREVAS